MDCGLNVYHACSVRCGPMDLRTCGCSVDLWVGQFMYAAEGVGRSSSMDLC